MKVRIREVLKKVLIVGTAVCTLFSVPVFGYISFREAAKSFEKSNVDNEKLKETTVYIVGDSTACEYGYDENYAVPRAGWGMYLSKYLKSEAKVVDLALAGRSSKSFTTEENYKKLFNDIKEGDFLLIQFGHNDAKNKTEEDLQTRYTDPQGDKDTEGSFKNSLYVNYILPAREKGAVPVLISPVSRRKFDAEGKVTDSHGFYDDAVRELAEEAEVHFVDMTGLTEEMYNFFGDDYTKALHAVYKDFSKGIDNTHYSHYGAETIAMSFAAAVNEKAFSMNIDVGEDFPLSKYVIDTDDLKKENVLDDYTYISRGKFISLLMRAVGIDGEAKENFADVDQNADYANAVGLAKEAGIAFGDDKGRFNPEDKIKGYELPLFVMRTLRYLNYEYKPADYENFDSLRKLNYENKSVPVYAKQDFVDFCEIFGEYLGVFYVNEQRVETFMAQDKVIELYELLAENAQSKEQSIEDLEKVENTK